MTTPWGPTNEDLVAVSAAMEWSSIDIANLSSYYVDEPDPRLVPMPKIMRITLKAAVKCGLMQPRSVVTCIYCHEAYPPGTPASGADRLKDHIIRECPEHPMRRFFQLARALVWAKRIERDELENYAEALLRAVIAGDSLPLEPWFPSDVPPLGSGTDNGEVVWY